MLGQAIGHPFPCLLGFEVEPAPRLLPQPGQLGGHLHLLAAPQELLGEPPPVVAGRHGLLQLHRAPGFDPEHLLGDEGLVSLLDDGVASPIGHTALRTWG